MNSNKNNLNSKTSSLFKLEPNAHWVSRPKPDTRICEYDRHANIKPKPDINKNQLNFYKTFKKGFPLPLNFCFFT